MLVFAICFSQFAFGQKANKVTDKPVTISGKVFNQNQDPVVGAVLYIDNMKTSIVTKNDGSYKIKVSPSAVNLEVRSAIYGTSEKPINGQSTINFSLANPDGKVIATRDSLANIAVRDNDTKTSRSRGKKMNTYNDIYQMIRGEVSGVMVSGRSVQIQQGHSFIGSSTPLFVINGVVVNSIDEVNPLEVRSIKVLKGSEAAIYGVRGSNGVISITLKNGTEKEN